MKAGRTLLLMFLWPVLSLLVVAIGIGYWSLTSLKQQFSYNYDLQTQDIQVVQRAADFSREIGTIHQQVSSAIDSARKGTLSEVKLYYLHADIVNHFALLSEQVDALANSELLKEVNHGSVKALQAHFNEYRRFILMATDIIAIDPKTADGYVQLAQNNFVQFSLYTQRITKLLAERTQVRSDNNYLTLEQFFYSVLAIGFVGLLLMVLLATFSAGLVSRKMLQIADALSLLARSDHQEKLALPQIEKMQLKSRGEFGRIAGALLSFRDAIERRKQAEDEAFQLAFYDSLTQLPNRNLLVERMQHVISLSERSQQYGALLYFDLDHFKNINDAQGHTAGDQLLIQVAERLLSQFDDQKLLARVGGDEFVIVDESLGKDLDQAARAAEELAETIRQQINLPFDIDGNSFFTSPSIGIVLFGAEQTSVDNLLKFGETAMYAAKQDGRNTFSFYDPAVQQRIEARLRMESELRQAIEKDQLVLFYQLQVEMGQAIGVEALIRWRHPERGYVSPADFIPLAEETGLIVPIGRWVIETACKQLKDWANRPIFSGLRVSVNVSARQFKETGFVEEVLSVIQSYQIDPSKLKIELTESTLLDSVEPSIEKMRQLQNHGVRFALDDFGTGYSSLQYLKQLPLNQIKIDQSFVRDLAKDPDDAVIVQTIIAMSHALGLDVIAEGVETEQQKAILAEMGCNKYQGYLFAKPCPVNQLPI